MVLYVSLTNTAILAHFILESYRKSSVLARKLFFLTFFTNFLPIFIVMSLHRLHCFSPQIFIRLHFSRLCQKNDCRPAKFLNIPFSSPRCTNNRCFLYDFNPSNHKSITDHLQNGSQFFCLYKTIFPCIHLVNRSIVICHLIYCMEILL